MSADYETEHLQGYSHADFLHIVTKGGERSAGGPLISLSWSEFREIQSMMQDWHRERQRQERLSKPGRRCPECGHLPGRHWNGNGKCSVGHCDCLGSLR